MPDQQFNLDIGISTYDIPYERETTCILKIVPVNEEVKHTFYGNVG